MSYWMSLNEAKEVGQRFRHASQRLCTVTEAIEVQLTNPKGSGGDTSALKKSAGLSGTPAGLLPTPLSSLSPELAAHAPWSRTGAQIGRWHFHPKGRWHQQSAQRCSGFLQLALESPA